MVRDETAQNLKDRKKIMRRWHKERMKKKAVELYGYEDAVKYADHLCACSCYMCGNKRKNQGRTLQEKKQDIK